MSAVTFVVSLYCGVQIDQYDVDTEEAVDRISRQLLEHSIVTEGYGGEVPIVPVREKAIVRSSNSKTRRVPDAMRVLTVVLLLLCRALILLVLIVVFLYPQV